MPVVAKVFDSIGKVIQATDQPVTDTTTAHTDGQICAYDEMLDVSYQDNLAGNGKVSHFKRNLIDIIVRALKVEIWTGAWADFWFVYLESNELVDRVPATDASDLSVSDGGYHEFALPPSHSASRHQEYWCGQRWKLLQGKHQHSLVRQAKGRVSS